MTLKSISQTRLNDVGCILMEAAPFLFFLAVYAVLMGIFIHDALTHKCVSGYGIGSFVVADKFVRPRISSAKRKLLGKK